MNDIYARRVAQTTMLQHLYKIHGTLWAATQITREPLNGAFVKEEFMRINGSRQMPLLIPESCENNLPMSHWNHLAEHHAWAESARANAVRSQTPLTQHIASMGKMQSTVNTLRAAGSMQAMVNEHIARIEGTAAFEEAPLLDSTEDEKP